jgi:hypothetical protein
MDKKEQFVFPATTTPAKAVAGFFSVLSFLWHRFFIFSFGFVIGGIFILTNFYGGAKKQTEKTNNVSVEKNVSAWGQAKTAVVIKN